MVEAGFLWEGSSLDVAIECCNLYKRYGQIRAADGVSFEVYPGRVCGLLGPNGAGKTTTIRMLTTVIKPCSGTARVCGYDIIRDAAKVRRCAAVVPQSVWMNHYLSVWDNILVYLLLRGLTWREAKHRASWAVEVFGLEKYIRFRCEQLSGGLIRRVQVARTLASPAQCYFLDEPSIGLDPKMKVEFWGQLSALVRASGGTTLITTHQMEEVEALCDDVILIDKGRVVATGSVKALTEQLGVTTAEVDLAADRRPPAEELERLGMEWACEGNTLRLRFKRGAEMLPRLLAALDRNGISIRAVRVVPPKFQDIYLALVGDAESSGEAHEAGK